MADRPPILSAVTLPLDEPPGQTGRLAAVPGLAGCSPCVHLAHEPRRWVARLLRRGVCQAGTFRLVAEAPGAFGDLDQHPVGGGQVVWVKAGVHPPGDRADGLAQPGVESGALGGELGGAGAVGGTVSDQALGFEAVQEPGDLGAIEPQLRLAGEVVVQLGG